MSRILKSRRAKVVLGAVAALAIAVTAVAYWTSTGSSNTTVAGSAGDSAAWAFTNVDGSVAGLAPGVAAKNLSADITNASTDTATYRLHTIVATITSVDTPNATTAHPCGIGDFRLSDNGTEGWVTSSDTNGTNDVATLTVNTEYANGHGTSFSKLGIEMYDDASANQDGCKGATVHVGYAAS